MKPCNERSWSEASVVCLSADSEEAMSRNMRGGRKAVVSCALLGTFFLLGCEGGMSGSPASSDSTDGVGYRGERTLVSASWYGKKFHGRTTASGEPFDMHALTCAHRDYPFGTLLRVSNPITGSESICTVNDRGPFSALRDIDLSFGVAVQVDLVDSGVALLYIEPMGLDLTYHDIDDGLFCSQAVAHADRPVPLGLCMTFAPAAPLREDS